MVCTAIKDLKYIQRDMEGVKVKTKRFIDILSKKFESIKNEDIDIVIEIELPLNENKKTKNIAW